MVGSRCRSPSTDGAGYSTVLLTRNKMGLMQWLTFLSCVQLDSATLVQRLCESCVGGAAVRAQQLQPHVLSTEA